MELFTSLADIRKLAGYSTQQELADAVEGFERVTIAKWEAGERYPRPATLIKLAKALHVSEGEIINAITTFREAKKRRSTP